MVASISFVLITKFTSLEFIIRYRGLTREILIILVYSKDGDRKLFVQIFPFSVALCIKYTNKRMDSSICANPGL